MRISSPPNVAVYHDALDSAPDVRSNAQCWGVVGGELMKDIIDGAISRKISYLLCEMGFDQKKRLEEYFKEFNVEFYSFYKDYEKFDRGFTLKFK